MNILEIFELRGVLKKKDVTPWQTFGGQGMKFALESYDWKGYACVSHLTMRAFWGLMKMDTLICTPYSKDLPIFSYDYICAMGRRTLLLETYDTTVEPVDLSPMVAVKEKYANLKDKPTKPAWYDALKMAPTVAKVGKEAKLTAMTREMVAAYLSLCDSANDVGRERKTAKNSEFAEGLIKDGPAFRAVSKMIGIEEAKTLFRQFIFGTEHRD